MSAMLEKARANRTRALRFHAMRNALLTDSFGPLGAEFAGAAPDLPHPLFVSTRMADEPHAA